MCGGAAQDQQAIPRLIESTAVLYRAAHGGGAGGDVEGDIVLQEDLIADRDVFAKIQSHRARKR